MPKPNIDIYVKHMGSTAFEQIHLQGEGETVVLDLGDVAEFSLLDDPSTEKPLDFFRAVRDANGDFSITKRPKTGGDHFGLEVKKNPAQVEITWHPEKGNVNVKFLKTPVTQPPAKPVVPVAVEPNPASTAKPPGPNGSANGEALKTSGFVPKNGFGWERQLTPGETIEIQVEGTRFEVFLNETVGVYLKAIGSPKNEEFHVDPEGQPASVRSYKVSLTKDGILRLKFEPPAPKAPAQTASQPEPEKTKTATPPPAEDKGETQMQPVRITKAVYKRSLQFLLSKEMSDFANLRGATNGIRIVNVKVDINTGEILQCGNGDSNLGFVMEAGNVISKVQIRDPRLRPFAEGLRLLVWEYNKKIITRLAKTLSKLRGTEDFGLNKRRYASACEIASRSPKVAMDGIVVENSANRPTVPAEGVKTSPLLEYGLPVTANAIMLLAGIMSEWLIKEKVVHRELKPWEKNVVRIAPSSPFIVSALLGGWCTAFPLALGFVTAVPAAKAVEKSMKMMGIRDPETLDYGSWIGSVTILTAAELAKVEGKTYMKATKEAFLKGGVKLGVKTTTKQAIGRVGGVVVSLVQGVDIGTMLDVGIGAFVNRNGDGTFTGLFDSYNNPRDIVEMPDGGFFLDSSQIAQDVKENPEQWLFYLGTKTPGMHTPEFLALWGAAKLCKWIFA